MLAYVLCSQGRIDLRSSEINQIAWGVNQSGLLRLPAGYKEHHKYVKCDTGHKTALSISPAGERIKKALRN